MSDPVACETVPGPKTDPTKRRAEAGVSPAVKQRSPLVLLGTIGADGYGGERSHRDRTGPQQNFPRTLIRCTRDRRQAGSRSKAVVEMGGFMIPTSSLGQSPRWRKGSSLAKPRKIESPHHVRLVKVDIGGARLNAEFMRYAVVLEQR